MVGGFDFPVEQGAVLQQGGVEEPLVGDRFAGAPVVELPLSLRETLAMDLHEFGWRTAEVHLKAIRKMSGMRKLEFGGDFLDSSSIAQKERGFEQADFIEPMLRAAIESFFEITLQLADGDLADFGQSTGAITSLAGRTNPVVSWICVTIHW